MHNLQELTGKEEIALAKYHQYAVWLGRMEFILGVGMGLGFPALAWLLYVNYSDYVMDMILAACLLLSGLSGWLCALGGIGILERKRWGVPPSMIGLIGLIIFPALIVVGGFESLEGDIDFHLPTMYSFGMLLLGIPLSMAPIGGLVLLYHKEADKYYRK